MSKKAWPILYSNLIDKMVRDFLDIRNKLQEIRKEKDVYILNIYRYINKVKKREERRFLKLKYGKKKREKEKRGKESNLME